MSTYEAGDLVELTLLVEGADGTTTATVAVVAPDGTSSAPAATSNVGRDVWTALLEVPVAGLYFPVWTVAGTQEGVAYDTTVRVAAPPYTVPSGARVYATTTDWANAIAGTAPPTGALRTLAAASRRIDRMLLCAHYDTDDDGLPTDADVIVAMRDATVAQALYMREIGDAYGLGAAAQYDNVSIGRVTLARRQGSGGSATALYASEAVETLRQAGMLGGGPTGGYS